MAPFWKKHDKTTIAELEEYYAAQEKNRQSPRAWFMAILSLLITVGIIAGLFFAGRWLFRTITSNSDTSTDVVTVVKGSESTYNLPTFDSDELGERGVSFGDSTSNNASDVVQGDTNDSTTVRTPGVVSEEAASTERNVASRESTTDSETARSADSPETTTSELPKTGASELILITPMIAGVAGYLFSRNRQMNR